MVIRGPKPRYGATVPSDQRASEVAIFHIDPKIAQIRGTTAAELRARATLTAVEPAYREFKPGDPRRARSRYDSYWYGRWNTDHTPADSSHPSADDKP